MQEVRGGSDADRAAKAPSGEALLKASGIAPKQVLPKTAQQRAAHKATLLSKSAANMRRHQSKVSRSRTRHFQSKASRGKKR